jgi:hypothetical protein
MPFFLFWWLPFSDSLGVVLHIFRETKVESLSYTFPTFSSCWILIVKHYWPHVSWCSSPTQVALGIQVSACRFRLCFTLQDTGSSRKLTLQLEMEHENATCNHQESVACLWAMLNCLPARVYVSDMIGVMNQSLFLMGSLEEKKTSLYFSGHEHLLLNALWSLHVVCRAE